MQSSLTPTERKRTIRTSKPNHMKRVAIEGKTLKECLQAMTMLAQACLHSWQEQQVIGRAEYQNNKVRLFNNVGSRILLIPCIRPV